MKTLSTVRSPGAYALLLGCLALACAAGAGAATAAPVALATAMPTTMATATAPAAAPTPTPAASASSISVTRSTPATSPNPDGSATAEEPANTSPDFGGPVAPQPWYSIEEEVVPSYDGVSGSSNTLNLRTQLPLGRILSGFNQLSGFDHLQIARVKLPIVISAPSNAAKGQGDATFVELEYMGTKQQQWIVGPSFKLPTASTSTLGSGKWCVGPAAGYSFVQGRRTLGLYMQSFFSFAGPNTRPPVSQLQFQPALVEQLAHGWSIGTSNMQFTYNFEKPAWAVVPLGVRIAKNFKSGAGQLLAGFEAETNLLVAPGQPAWTLRINFKWVPGR